MNFSADRSSLLGIGKEVLKAPVNVLKVLFIPQPNEPRIGTAFRRVTIVLFELAVAVVMNVDDWAFNKIDETLFRAQNAVCRVVTDHLNVRAMPSLSSEVLFQITNGTSVTYDISTKQPDGDATFAQVEVIEGPDFRREYHSDTAPYIAVGNGYCATN